MTWIVDSLGAYYSRFAPEPDMDDWEEHLTRRFDGFSEGEKARYERSLTSYLASVRRNFEFGVNLVADADWPHVIRLKRKYKHLPDFFYVGKGLLMVSAPMRALLEAFDPGVHEFRDIPFDYETDEKFFAFHTPTSLQAVDIAASDPKHVKWYQDAQKYSCNYGEIGSAGVAFDQERTKGRGFWRDNTLHVPCYCISDEFRRAISREKLSFPKVLKTLTAG